MSSSCRRLRRVFSCHSKAELNIQASAPASPGHIARLENLEGSLITLGLCLRQSPVGTGPQGSVAILKLNWEGFNGFKGFRLR